MSGVVAIVVAVTPAWMAVAGSPGGWEHIGLSGGGAMFTPAISPIDPNLIMLNCDMSCAFLSHDGGMTWQMIHHAQLRGNTRCQAGFHPRDINVIFAPNAWSGRLHVSHDRGKTWKKIGDLQGRLEGEIAIDPVAPNRMFVGSGQRVWRSGDGGHTWSWVSGPHGGSVFRGPIEPQGSI